MNNLCVTVSIKLCKNGHREISMYTRPSVYIRGCQIDDTGPQLLISFENLTSFIRNIGIIFKVNNYRVLTTKQFEHSEFILPTY